MKRQVWLIQGLSTLVTAVPRRRPPLVLWDFVLGICQALSPEAIGFLRACQTPCEETQVSRLLR